VVELQPTKWVMQHWTACLNSIPQSDLNKSKFIQIQVKHELLHLSCSQAANYFGWLFYKFFRFLYHSWTVFGMFKLSIQNTIYKSFFNWTVMCCWHPKWLFWMFQCCLYWHLYGTYFWLWQRGNEMNVNERLNRNAPLLQQFHSICFYKNSHL